MDLVPAPAGHANANANAFDVVVYVLSIDNVKEHKLLFPIDH
jgi:hypothetical protein